MAETERCPVPPLGCLVRHDESAFGGEEVSEIVLITGMIGEFVILLQELLNWAVGDGDGVRKA